MVLDPPLNGEYVTINDIKYTGFQVVEFMFWSCNPVAQGGSTTEPMYPIFNISVVVSYKPFENKDVIISSCYQNVMILGEV